MTTYQDKYDADMKKIAKSSFEKHELASRSGDRQWIIAKPYDDGSGYQGIYKTEIICLFNNSIYVGGDIDVVVFGYGPVSPKARLVWIGKHEGMGYISQKAAIGNGGTRAERWDRDQAEEQLEEALNDEGLSLSADDRACLETALDCVDDGEFPVWSELPGDAWEYLENLGKVVSPSIYYAHAALSKLCDLLGIPKEKTDG